MFHQLSQWLIDPSGLTPHGFCLLWEPGLIWTYAISDAGIAAAYFTIPLALAVFAGRRKDIVFRSIFVLFASFITLCGATHLLDVVTLWVPAYGLQAVVKATTAIASIITAVVLWKLLPTALALPSPAQLDSANNALRESEARYRSSFVHSPVPMYTLTPAGIITGASRTWLQLLGYAENEVLGQNITELRAPESRMAFESDIAQLLQHGEIHDLERRYRRHDGGIVDVLLSARLEQRDGQAWIVCVLVDITERRRAEEALRASQEQLHQSQKMEAVGQLTGGIAHDFNNMLQTITGGLELMERRVAQGRTEEAGRFIMSARKAAESATALTNRMLAFARRQALQPIVVYPDALLNGMVDLISSGLGPLVYLQLDLKDGKWATQCDANQLESALLNIVLNARDAMPDGGTIRIATADRTLSAADVNDLNGLQPGDYVQIDVSDTGIGMSPEVLQRAFEPFFTTRPFGQGTGLGLSQVYGFVRQSGGAVRLESQPGKGTVVRLYLPRAKLLNGNGAQKTVSGNDQTTRGNARILVVEDEMRIREMITALLQEHGYTTIDAEDGPSGLYIVQSAVHLDLVVTDVGLPGLNGRQLADAARVKRPDLPVLFITGYAGGALEEIELPPGMSILRKPFAFDALVARVGELLRSARATA